MPIESTKSTDGMGGGRRRNLLPEIFWKVHICPEHWQCRVQDLQHQRCSYTSSSPREVRMAVCIAACSPWKSSKEGMGFNVACIVFMLLLARRTLEMSICVLLIAKLLHNVVWIERNQTQCLAVSLFEAFVNM